MRPNLIFKKFNGFWNRKSKKSNKRKGFKNMTFFLHGFFTNFGKSWDGLGEVLGSILASKKNPQRPKLYSMCCARTAALHCGNKKQKVNASRVFLQQSLHHVQKCRQERKMCQHMANLGLQNRGWSVPRREKNDQEARQMQQDVKNAPKKRLRPKKKPK